MPSYWDKSPLEPGDRIVVLANFDSLQNIECGDRQLPDCKLKVRKAPSQDSIIKATATIAFICSCSPDIVQQLMYDLAGILDCHIYKHQGQLLLRKLRKLGVDAAVIENFRIG